MGIRDHNPRDPSIKSQTKGWGIFSSSEGRQECSTYDFNHYPFTLKNSPEEG